MANEWDAPEDAACSRDSRLGQGTARWLFLQYYACTVCLWKNYVFLYFLIPLSSIKSWIVVTSGFYRLKTLALSIFVRPIYVLCWFSCFNNTCLFETFAFCIELHANDVMIKLASPCILKFLHALWSNLHIMFDRLKTMLYMRMEENHIGDTLAAVCWLVILSLGKGSALLLIYYWNTMVTFLFENLSKRYKTIG